MRVKTGPEETYGLTRYVFYLGTMRLNNRRNLDKTRGFRNKEKAASTRLVEHQHVGFVTIV